MKRALIVIGLCGLLLSGCGEDKTDGKNEYVDEVNAVQQRFARSVMQLDSGSNLPRAIARRIARLRAAIAGTTGELRAIEPPGAAAAAHAQLVATLEAYSARLERASRGITSRFPAAAARSAQAVVAATARAQAAFDAAIARINKGLRS